MINSNIQSELRSQYNPEGSEKRNYQLSLLDMLSDFDRICREIGVHYWLSSGTLLGAVRHSGFIPWDDDIDVDMTREDYNRLKKYFKETDKYVIQDYHNDPYYYWPFAKFRQKNTLVHDATKADQHYKFKGNYIDIFIIERRNDFIAKLFVYPSRFLYKLSMKKKMNILQKMIFFSIKYCSLWSAKILRYLTVPFRGKIAGHAYGSIFSSPNRSFDEIFPVTTISFEGRDFMAPHDSDAYLKRMFSDYMRIPEIKEMHMK